VPRVEQLAVVVPARNEARLLPRCLQALGAAAAQLRIDLPEVALSVVVVLDSCTDDSAAVLNQFGDVGALAVTVGTVGAARQAGVAHLSAAAPDAGPDWFAMTDADSAVRADWLVHQVRAAHSGADLLLGTVVPDACEISAVQFARWQEAHQAGDGHGHVYGANLGFSRRALVATGGFRGLLAHEDVDLAERIKAVGLPWVASARCPVLTSARMVGRTPVGFAGYLRGELTSHLIEPSARGV